MEDVYEIAYKEMVYNMIFDTINERYAEAQQESDEDKGDLFKAGLRACVLGSERDHKKSLGNVGGLKGAKKLWKK